jgi:ribosomal protein L37E
VVATDLRCGACGHNVRGVRKDAACPECGHPVAESLRGAAVEAGRREQGADAVRTFGRGFLFAAPVGIAAVGCLGGPVALLAIVGAVQRLVALRTAGQCLPKQAFLDLPERHRAWNVAIAELVTGGLFLVMVSTGIVAALPPTAAACVAVALQSIWFGTVGLGLVTGSLLAQRVDERFATGLERSPWPVIATFIAVGLQLLADAATPVIGGWALIPRLAAIGCWIWAAGLTAWDVSGTGEELVAEPTDRTLRAPSDAPAPGEQVPDPSVVRPARLRTPDDDAPIPID